MEPPLQRRGPILLLLLRIAAAAAAPRSPTGSRACPAPSLKDPTRNAPAAAAAVAAAAADAALSQDAFEESSERQQRLLAQ